MYIFRKTVEIGIGIFHMASQLASVNSNALFLLLMTMTNKILQKFLAHTDQNQSGDISLAEFIHYLKEHEKNLKLVFSHLDKNKDGISFFVFI